MKSHEQDLLTVCRCILLDAAAKCATEKASVLRDFETIRSRTEHEGISFFMITLPSFGQEFERCLDQKEVTSSSFVGWQKNQCLPSFLRGFTKLVFDAGTGGLHVHPDIAAIEGIRQIAYSFKKLLLPCSPKREKETLSGYIEVEQFLKASMYPRDADLFLKISDLLWGSVFANFQISECIPKHGPGQTAEGINGNRKYLQRVWYERLEPFFPICDYLLVNYNQLESSDFGLDSFSVVQEEQETPVKVSFVPKTFKGPRIIAMEPVCFQYAQQGISRVLVNTLESHWLTSGHINFTDQSINQRLAITASHDGLSATLDLSSASDRVPATLVGQMLNVYPDLRDAIFACRSKAAQIPGGEVIALSKFASMGSALCFPIESMYFFTVILLALLEKQQLPVSLRNLYKVSRGVYVYGDDIIIPIDAVEIVSETLTRFYCKVNSSKSFWNGKFRESCGMDAYDGNCVTPTYLRRIRPRNMRMVKEIISWIATSNLFYKRGYWLTAALLKNKVESVTGKLPVIREDSPGLGWFSFMGTFAKGKWSKTLHCMLYSTFVESPIYKQDPLDDWPALLKCLINLEYRQSDDIEVDSKHLERSSRSGTSALKRRWLPLS